MLCDDGLVVDGLTTAEDARVIVEDDLVTMEEDVGVGLIVVAAEDGLTVVVRTFVVVITVNNT